MQAAGIFTCDVYKGAEIADIDRLLIDMRDALFLIGWQAALLTAERGRLAQPALQLTPPLGTAHLLHRGGHI
jgi:hypothetical protein